MGTLPYIYKTISKEQSNLIDALLLTTTTKQFDAICLYKPRELLAIEHAKAAAQSCQNESVHILLIFGEHHNFQATINSLNDTSVTYAGSIDTLKALPNPSDSASSKDRFFASDEFKNTNTQLPPLNFAKEDIVQQDNITPQLQPLTLSPLKKK